MIMTRTPLQGLKEKIKMVKTNRFSYWCFPHSKDIGNLPSLCNMWGTEKVEREMLNPIWTSILIHDNNEWQCILKALKINKNGKLYEWGNGVVIYTDQINEEEINTILTNYIKFYAS